MGSHRKAASTIVKEQAAQIEELEKKLKAAESSKDGWYKTHLESQAIVDEIHTMLDAAPNPPQRECPQREGQYGQTKLSLMARLSIWISSREMKA